MSHSYPSPSPTSPVVELSSPSPSPSSKSSESPTVSANSQNGDLQPKYHVASHSVRITKHGYAIDPVELRYQEILNGLSAESRRDSLTSFDSSHIGHTILKLIRGFWSQPAFPKGHIANRTDKNASISTILSEFSQYPIFPHNETYGGMAKDMEPPRLGARSRLMNRKNGAKKGIRRLSIDSDQLGNTVTPVSYASTKTPNSNSPNDDRLNKSIKDKFVALSPTPQYTRPSSPSIRSSTSSSSSSSSSSLNSAGTTKMSNKNKKRSSTDSTGFLGLFTSTRLSSKPSLPPPDSSHYYSWIPRDKEQITELVTLMCQQMEKVFANESRIVQVGSPCTVLGDIHGNLTDLRTYERSLWPKAPVCVNSNYLFLGDYVDRGDFSVECVLYLFAMKLISPTRFFLLRGNHEVATIQRQYTFGRECESKFGSSGRQIWHLFNKVFDLMPIAGIIDSQIFCAHGGIPRSITSVSRLAKEIPTPLENPEIQCPAAWEILWNDPITDSELVGMIEMDNAVVTQTQITQSHPSADGQELVTTTSGTTAIETAAQPEPHRAQQQARALSEADSVLNREPPGAISFYIRPDSETANGNSTTQTATTTESKQTTTTVSKISSNNTEASITAAASNEAEVSKKENDSTLRSVPSDTSSIASTSPQQMLNDGFVANIKRGTAFLFSDQAINNFLRVNKLSHVIRAHEVIPTGFAFHGNGRVVTIFSSSKYCGLNNQAACCLVDQRRIRILRLDTGDAGE